MIKLGLNKTSSERKSDRIMDRLNISPNNHKYIKNKTTIKLKLLNKSFALIMTCLEKEIQNNYLFVTYFCIQSHLSLLKNGIKNCSTVSFITMSLQKVQCKILHSTN